MLVPSPPPRPPLPIISSRILSYPPKFRSPRQAWVTNLDTVEEEKLGLIDLHPSVFAEKPRVDSITENIRWQKMYRFVVRITIFLLIVTSKFLTITTHFCSVTHIQKCATKSREAVGSLVRRKVLAGQGTALSARPSGREAVSSTAPDRPTRTSTCCPSTPGSTGSGQHCPLNSPR